MTTLLASEQDLILRGITVPADMDAITVLASATDAVRDAAGCSITARTSTITLVADDRCELDLPFGPVSGIASIVVAGVTVTGWTKLGDTVLMPTGWTECLPVEVTVTYTHGYPVVPQDIVDLVCSMTAQAFKETGGDYGSSSLVTSVRLGDFSEQRAHPAGTDSPSPVALPDSVRQRLRARFGSSVAVIRVH